VLAHARGEPLPRHGTVGERAVAETTFCEKLAHERLELRHPGPDTPQLLATSLRPAASVRRHGATAECLSARS